MVRTIAILIALGAFAVVQGQTPNLAGLPEADTLIYINPQRIFNDAVPKVNTEADVAKLRQAFNDLRQSVGVDPSRLDYVVIALRFRKPAADLSFQMPEFMLVTSGDFSADSLVRTARSVIDTAVEEKYGSNTLLLVTIDDIARQAEKTPLLKPFSQVAIAPLNSNTLAVGNVSYLKAAIDAAGGSERVNREILNSLMRDPNALVSFAGSPWTSFAKSFGLVGTETTPRTPRCETKLGDFYAAITQEGTNFRLRGAMNADNPDTAKILGGLLTMILKTVPSENNDVKSFPSLMKQVNITTTDTEVLVHADIPQQVVADFIREQMKPKVADASASKTVASPPKPPVKKRRVRRKQ